MIGKNKKRHPVAGKPKERNFPNVRLSVKTTDRQFFINYSQTLMKTWSIPDDISDVETITTGLPKSSPCELCVDHFFKYTPISDYTTKSIWSSILSRLQKIINYIKLRNISEKI